MTCHHQHLASTSPVAIKRRTTNTRTVNQRKQRRRDNQGQLQQQRKVSVTMELSSSWPFYKTRGPEREDIIPSAEETCSNSSSDDNLDDDGVTSTNTSTSTIERKVKNKTRHVLFASLDESEIISQHPPAMNPRELWYDAADYVQFRNHALIAAHDKAAQPWFSDVVQAYRALKFATHAQQVYEILRPSSPDVNDAATTPSVAAAPALYCGLETWVLQTGLEKTQRRQELMHSVRYWQSQSDILPTIRRKQIRKASLALSRPAGMLAVYMARRVAQNLDSP